MALSATGRTLRIRRQNNYTDSPGSEAMEDEPMRPPASSFKRKSGRIAVRVQLDGAVESFGVAAVVGQFLDGLPDVDDGFSSDEEIFKDVRTYVRQTMGKAAVVRAEAGLCGAGGEEDINGQASRAATQWLEGGATGSNYVTVKHPPPDAPIDVPPLPGFDRKGPNIYPNGLWFQLPLTCRHWFHPKFVADLERAELPVFGLSEQEYRDLRDTILDAYNADPSKYLSIRNARDATGFGEVGVLTKVWGFLDFWGIINYVADPSSAPRYSKKLIDFPIGAPSYAIPEILCSACHKACSFTAFVLKPDAAPLVPAEQLAKARFCSTCMNTGSYPPFFSRDSFDQIDVHLPSTVNPEWTEEETMRMIEGIDRYGPDWEPVARLVGGGKTAAQCLLHFVQIPIQDRYMDLEPKNILPKQNPFRNEASELVKLLGVLSSAVPVEASSLVAALVHQ